jgi:hypothetical protein
MCIVSLASLETKEHAVFHTLDAEIWMHSTRQKGPVDRFDVRTQDWLKRRCVGLEGVVVVVLHITGASLRPR